MVNLQQEGTTKEVSEDIQGCDKHVSQVMSPSITFGNQGKKATEEDEKSVKPSKVTTSRSSKEVDENFMEKISQEAKAKTSQEARAKTSEKEAKTSGSFEEEISEEQATTSRSSKDEEAILEGLCKILEKKD